MCISVRDAAFGSGAPGVLAVGSFGTVCVGQAGGGHPLGNRSGTAGPRGGRSRDPRRMRRLCV